MPLILPILIATALMPAGIHGLSPLEGAVQRTVASTEGSVELHLAEVSPRGAEGGVAVPASGDSGGHDTYTDSGPTCSLELHYKDGHDGDPTQVDTYTLHWQSRDKAGDPNELWVIAGSAIFKCSDTNSIFGTLLPKLAERFQEACVSDGTLEQGYWQQIGKIAVNNPNSSSQQWGQVLAQLLAKLRGGTAGYSYDRQHRVYVAYVDPSSSGEITLPAAASGSGPFVGIGTQNAAMYGAGVKFAHTDDATQTRGVWCEVADQEPDDTLAATLVGKKTTDPEDAWSTNPLTIFPGEEVEFKWSSNAEKCLAIPGDAFSTGDAASGATDQVTEPDLGDTNTYRVYCEAAGSSPVSSNGIDVTVAEDGVDLSADPTRVRTGDSTTLDWDTKANDPSSCKLTGPGVNLDPLVSGDGESATTTLPTTGSTDVTIEGQSTFTLSCDSGAAATVHIDVIPQVFES